jgi:hypothetical protein
MIPTIINICGVPHAVLLCKDEFDLDSHFGQIEYTQALIKINQDMPESMQMQSLCHEWLHGALVMLGFNEQSQNEQFVQALSMAINQTFTVKGVSE